MFLDTGADSYSSTLLYYDINTEYYIILESSIIEVRVLLVDYTIVRVLDLLQYVDSIYAAPREFT